MSKLWGGRFRAGSNAASNKDPAMDELGVSIDIDKRLCTVDIIGSKAYTKALNQAKLLTDDETRTILHGLRQIQQEWLENNFVTQDTDEDIHTANERRLKEIIGEVGGKLHTGRSRNDQIATDTRLWMLQEIRAQKQLIRELIGALVSKASDEEFLDCLMPGYTHLQRAQPVRASHWILSHAWSFINDLKKLATIEDTTSVLPLGSGAIAGNPFTIDREFLARELGFKHISQNSMHAVSDRDFIGDFLYWVSMVSVHLSRLAEDFVIYSTAEFGFVKLSDAYSTGSSLMPQKRNPDNAELIRGKSGSNIGRCFGFMCTLKGQPSTYNRDFEEIKTPLFESADATTTMLRVARGMVATMEINREKCEQALSPDMLATDVAYYLVRKGVPFRDAHKQAGECVALAEKKAITIATLTLDDFRTINAKFDADISETFSYEASVDQYEATGGTARLAVLKQIERINETLDLDAEVSI